jgi:hypothetical protein
MSHHACFNSGLEVAYNTPKPQAVYLQLSSHQKDGKGLKKSVKSNYAGFTSGLTELCNTSQPKTCVQVIQ